MSTVYTDAGEARVCALIDGSNTLPLNATNSRIGWGTGAGTAAKTSTTLFTEAPEARVAPVVSRPVADTVQWVATMTASASRTITNAGLFDAATGGTLVVHGSFAGVTLATNDQIQFTFTLQQT